MDKLSRCLNPVLFDSIFLSQYSCDLLSDGFEYGLLDTWMKMETINAETKKYTRRCWALKKSLAHIYGMYHAVWHIFSITSDSFIKSIRNCIRQLILRSVNNRIRKLREVVEISRRVTQRENAVEIVLNMGYGHMPQHYPPSLPPGGKCPKLLNEKCVYLNQDIHYIQRLKNHTID